jgi:hypothetical protein
MKIGDKVIIPFGSRQGEAAFVRDIKNTTIWVCLESNPGGQAVPFHLHDFSAQIIIDRLQSGLNSEVKPKDKECYEDRETAIADMNRVAKLNPGVTLYLLKAIQEVTYEKKLTKREVIY